MKKYILLVLLTLNTEYVQAKIEACPSDKPLQDLKGECYSCDEDQIIIAKNTDACPNRDQYTQNKYLQMSYSIKTCPIGYIRNSQGVCSECSNTIIVPDLEYSAYVNAEYVKLKQYADEHSNYPQKSFVLESAYKTYCNPSKIVQDKRDFNDYPCAHENNKPLLGIDGKCYACNEENLKIQTTGSFDILFAKRMCPDYIFYKNGQKCSFENPILTKEGCKSCKYFKSVGLDIPYCPNTKDLMYLQTSETLTKKDFGIQKNTTPAEYERSADTLALQYRKLNNGKDAPECDMCPGLRKNTLLDGGYLSEPICQGKQPIEYIDSQGIKFCYPCQVNTGLILNDDLTMEKIKNMCPNRTIITHTYHVNSLTNPTVTDYVSVLPCRNGLYDYNGVCYLDKKEINKVIQEHRVWSNYW